MKMSNMSKILIILLSMTLFCSSSAWANELENKKLNEKKKEVKKVTQQLIDNIVNKNIEGILSVVADPFMCGDIFFPLDKVKNDIYDNNSRLSSRLFDTKKYSEGHRRIFKSLRDYFIERSNDNIAIYFLEDAEGVNYDVAQVPFSRDIDFLFQFEDGKWLLIEGLYSCP